MRLPDLDLDVASRWAGDVVNVDLRGDDAGIVLSNNALLMYAINHLLNQVFYRRAPGSFSAVVDCGDYRAMRVLELELMAKKAAEKVRVTGVPYPLQPMPAVERRVIHLALADEAGVRTESRGGGPHRHVVILTSH